MLLLTLRKHFLIYNVNFHECKEFLFREKIKNENNTIDAKNCLVSNITPNINTGTTFNNIANPIYFSDLLNTLKFKRIYPITEKIVITISKLVTTSSPEVNI